MVLQQNDSVSIWGWAGPADKIYVTTGWDGRIDSTITSNGAKWKLKVKTPNAGGPYTISVRARNKTLTLTDVLIGEVWICSGQSNMEWSYNHGLKDVRDELPKCFNKNIRFFHINKTTSDYPQDDVVASWEICDSTTLKRFSAVGYFFGKSLHKNLNIPIGLIHSSWGGTPAEVWVQEELVTGVTELNEASKKLHNARSWPVLPGKTFNAMIAPLSSYKIAGVIWYQGESNTGTNSTYEQLMKVLIDSWRKEWNTDFPFYLVQIAPYSYGNYNIGAMLQEAQIKLMSHRKTGTVVITDLVNDVNNIHPINKHDVGARLANWALAEKYSVKGIHYRSPQFKSMEVVKGKAILSFRDTASGLISKDKIVSGFFISGEKEQWFPADAKIEGDKIIISSKNVYSPAQVRFGFGNTIIGNVFSKEGLPLTPFRTDSWPVDQSPVR